MTVPVPDQLEYISDADGTTTEFPYPKRFLQSDEIIVLLRDADGVDTQQYLNQHYSIAGSAWPNGGAISFYVAPAVGVKVVRYRMTQAKQTVDLENRQRNDAPSVELQLDRLTMAIQDRGRLGDAAWWGLLAETAARVNGDKLLNLRVEQEIIDRINNDEALASLIGNIGSGNAPLFDTNLAVSLAIISPLVKAIRTAGYLYAGDGGDALYIWAVSEPVHAGKIQSADGAWWELVGTVHDARVFGVFPDTGGYMSLQIQAALDYLRIKDGGILQINAPGVYSMGHVLRIGSDTELKLHHLAVFKRNTPTNTMLLSYSDGLVGGYDAAKNIKVVGGAFDCNRDEQPDPCSVIAFGHCSDVFISTGIFNTSYRWHAIECNSSRDVIIENCLLRRGGQDEIGGEAIQIDGAYNDGTFPWFGPYDQTPCNNVKIRNNTIDDWATAIGSHSFGSDNQRHENIVIEQNDIRMHRIGINMMGWAGVTIQNNRIRGMGIGPASQWGIRSEPTRASGHNASDIKIVGNTFIGINRTADGSGNAGRGIGLVGYWDAPENTLQNVTITGNYFIDIGGHAIGIDRGLNVSVSDNKVNGCGGAGVYIYGTIDAGVIGNKIRSTGSLASINVVAAGTSDSSGAIIQGNKVSGAIFSNSPGAICANNKCSSLSYGGAATGIKGPNLVNGSVVA